MRYNIAMGNNNNKISPKFWISIIVLSVLSSIIAINLAKTAPSQQLENTTPTGTHVDSSSQNDQVQSREEDSTSNTPRLHGVSPYSEDSSEPKSAEPQDSTLTESSSSEPMSTQTYDYLAPSSSCLHSVSGICLDDLEDEAYSAGLYDYEYGYYGASLDYPDDCGTSCQEALEDAYDEGWYDSH